MWEVAGSSLTSPFSLSGLGVHRQTDGQTETQASLDISPVHSIHLADITSLQSNFGKGHLAATHPVLHGINCTCPLLHGIGCVLLQTTASTKSGQVHCAKVAGLMSPPKSATFWMDLEPADLICGFFGPHKTISNCISIHSAIFAQLCCTVPILYNMSPTIPLKCILSIRGSGPYLIWFLGFT